MTSVSRVATRAATSARGLCTRARTDTLLPDLLGAGKAPAAEWFRPRKPGQVRRRPRPWWGPYEDVPLAAAAARPVLEGRWGSLDCDFERLEEVLPGDGGNSRRAHLLETFGVLKIWRQSAAQCRAGLFHTAYLEPGSVPFGLLGQGGPGDVHDRSDLRAVLGEEAEAMLALLSSDALSWDSLAAFVLTGVAPDFATLPCGESRTLTRRQFAEAALVAVADAAAFACEEDESAARFVSGPSLSLEPEAATPTCNAKAKPAVELYWMSELCEQLRRDFPVAPPIFDGCWRTLRRASELEARDMYWHAVQQQAQRGSLSAADIDSLEDAVALNPFVAEPHVLLSQALMQHGRWGDASQHAMRALDLFYQWGTPWDKRASLSQWVALTQTLTRQASFGRDGLGAQAAPDAGALPLPEDCGPVIVPVVLQG